MKCKIFGGGVPVTSGTRYSGINDYSLNAVEAARQVLIPVDGTLRNLRAYTSAALGSGYYNVTVRLDGANTNLSVSVSDTTAVEDTDSVDVTAGQLLSVMFEPQTPDAAYAITWMLEFEADTSGYSIMTTSCGGTQVGTSGYIPILGQGLGTTESDVYIVCPCAGTIRSLRVKISAAAGGGKTRTIAVRKNGSSTGAPSVDLLDPATTGFDDTQLAVAAGDILSIVYSTDGAPVSAYLWAGVVFQPSTGGQFIIAWGGNEGTNLSNSAARYMLLAGSRNTFTTTAGKGKATYGDTDFQIKGVQILLAADPNPGSYTFTLQHNGTEASTPFTVQITSGNTTGNASGTFTPDADSYLNTKAVPASTPTATRPYISYIGYIEEVGGGAILPVMMSTYRNRRS